MRPGLTISCIGHAGVLLWGLVAFAAKPHDAPAVEPLPVEFVSATEFSQITAGVKNAPKAVEEAKPLADKVAELKPVKELAPKVADKPEIKTDAAAHESKAKPEPKPAEKPKQAAFKPDQIAEELKKDEAKKPPKPEEKKDARVTPKFDANQVAALLDKREPQRQLAAAETLNGAASLGAANGHAAHLSQSELDALRAKLISLWNPPPAVSTNPDQYVITIHIRLTRDYRLDGQPAVLTNGQGPLFEATRDSALRAVFQAQPYDMLSPPTYDQWKEMDINFDPREVFGG
jgi:colicin import membrane protein